MSFLRFFQLYLDDAYRAQGLFMGARMILRYSYDGDLTFTLGLCTLFDLGDLVGAFIGAATMRGAAYGFIGSSGFTILSGVIGVGLRGTIDLSDLVCVILGYGIVEVNGIFGARGFFNFLGATLYRNYYFLLFVGGVVGIIFLMVFLRVLFYIGFYGALGFGDFYGDIDLYMGIY